MNDAWMFLGAASLFLIACSMVLSDWRTVRATKIGEEHMAAQRVVLEMQKKAVADAEVWRIQMSADAEAWRVQHDNQHVFLDENLRRHMAQERVPAVGSRTS